MSTSRHHQANVFEEIGFDRESAALYKVKSYYLDALIDYIERFDTQAEAAKDLGITQPKVSMILNGKLSEFTSDWLIRTCARAGIEIQVPAMYYADA